ncbi:MAG: hypothetical protein ACK56I_26650 [bacterium]
MAISVIVTVGKFSASANDADSQFATGCVDASGALSPVTNFFHEDIHNSKGTRRARRKMINGKNLR